MHNPTLRFRKSRAGILHLLRRRLEETSVPPSLVVRNHSAVLVQSQTQTKTVTSSRRHEHTRSQPLTDRLRVEHNNRTMRTTLLKMMAQSEITERTKSFAIVSARMGPTDGTRDKVRNASVISGHDALMWRSKTMERQQKQGQNVALRARLPRLFMRRDAEERSVATQSLQIPSGNSRFSVVVQPRPTAAKLLVSTDKEKSRMDTTSLERYQSARGSVFRAETMRTQTICGNKVDVAIGTEEGPGGALHRKLWRIV